MGPAWAGTGPSGPLKTTKTPTAQGCLGNNSSSESKLCERYFFAIAKHYGRLPNPWPLTKAGLAEIRPRSASL